MQELQREITAFIVDNFLFGNEADAPSADDSFMDLGLIDSTGILELVAFVEDRYRVTVEDDELIPDNLDSVNNLAGFVSRKRR